MDLMGFFFSKNDPFSSIARFGKGTEWSQPKGMLNWLIPPTRYDMEPLPLDRSAGRFA